MAWLDCGQPATSKWRNPGHRRYRLLGRPFLPDGRYFYHRQEQGFLRQLHLALRTDVRAECGRLPMQQVPHQMPLDQAQARFCHYRIYAGLLQSQVQAHATAQPALPKGIWRRGGKKRKDSHSKRTDAEKEN